MRPLEAVRRFLVLPLFVALPGALAGQMPAAGEPAQVMVLGTYHFANPGLDVVQTEIGDVLEPAAQAEIAGIVDALVRFRPTHVAVEAPVSYAAALDSQYVAWRAGAHDLTRNEVQQLGFRIAARMDHERVHPIDHHGEFPFGPLMQYAGEHDPEAAGWIQEVLAGITAESERRHRDLGIVDILRLDNDPALLAQGHGIYVRVNEVGAGDSYVGADLLAAWYERNIRIASHIQALAESGDRVLVIIGSGHAQILRDLIGYDPELELVEALEYLPE